MHAYIQPTLNPINIDVILDYRFLGRLVSSIQFYAPYVKHYGLQIQHFISLILLKLHNIEY